MATARTVFSGGFYFITCAPSVEAARSACRENPRRAAWALCPAGHRSDSHAKPNPHACTCVDKNERGASCKHYQFQKETQAPKP